MILYMNFSIVLIPLLNKNLIHQYYVDSPDILFFDVVCVSIAFEHKKSVFSFNSPAYTLYILCTMIFTIENTKLNNQIKYIKILVV